ncbi:MAG: helix-turn-helix domain-containing protein [Candidatus Eremiobacteraeota bacterium]|nr:helix-turn-helix domain-containing protein [Candidatus Eremiobacteraeota bacterium]
MAALGERFRAAREARGLSLSDVAEQIRIRSVYLGAIEDENWTAIGAPVYTRGFLRTYARFLGLDPEEVVGEFNRATSSGSAPSTATAPAPSSISRLHEPRPRNLSPLIWIASLIAVALVAFVFYNEFTLHARQARTAALPSNTSPAPAADAMDGAAPAVSPSILPSANPSSSPQPKTLEVRLSAASWIRVAVDGSVSMEGTFPAGTARVFHGKNAVVRIGNAGGVDVFVDGRNLGKLGAEGDVVERSFTL